MNDTLVVILLIVNGVFVAAMLVILVTILLQGRRIARLARHTEELAMHLEETFHPDETHPVEPEEDREPHQ